MLWIQVSNFIKIRALVAEIFAKQYWRLFNPKFSMYFAYFHKLCSKMSEKWPKMTQKWLAHAQTWNFIFPSCPGIQNTCLCEFCSHLLYNCSRNFISSRLLRFFTYEIFPILTGSVRTLKNTMLNKSGYFRTLASMKKPTALEF